jgi:serine/threonine protein kinase
VAELRRAAGRIEDVERLAAVRRASEVKTEPTDLPDLGAPRFVPRRKLGTGGFGEVFEALDRERNAVVALKVLARRDPRALDGFKREFRSLSELAHPNLVQLYELHGAGDAWFFTMELVAGRDVLSDLRSASPGGPSAATGASSEDSTQISGSDPTASLDPSAGGAPVAVRVAPAVSAAAIDPSRVRAIFRQVALGLCFLHDAGRLHRDIKPSNIVVTPSGRAVILDLGLVFELEAGAEQSVNQVVGTPLYMAPEQASAGPVGPAVDWYAMGAMLYEVLTGQPPFVGSLAAILRAKLTEDPRPPAELVPGLPEDLCRLCLSLLARDPADRPGAKEILERLGPGSPRAASATPPESTLIGRTAELSALREAFAAAKSGRAVVALVHGRSGMGKSALCRHFTDALRAADRSVVVLAGRCFEQESVPYKALDSLVDALSRHVRRLGAAEADALMPRDAAALARLFPALLQVRAVEAARKPAAASDNLELRRRAFAALRELLARLGDRRPLVLFIDDLQWGDADSGALLSELLRPPDPPSLLLVVAYRSDETERSECLAALLPSLRAAAAHGLDLREIGVDRLSDDEARALALAELQDRGEGAGERAALIARESGGWPFFIRELSRFSGEIVAAAPPSIEEMLRARVAALPDDARRLLEVLAVAGQPIDRAAAAQAAELAGNEPACVSALRKLHLLRARGSSGREEIETYHDRIRETVAGALAVGPRRAHHGRLGRVLAASGEADAETLAIHFQAAGENEEAARYAEEAADRVMQALGFDRAARLYRQAIDLVPAYDARRRPLHAKLGAALEDAGRGAEAAAAYLVAAEGQAPAAALELRRRAAENQLISGHYEEGITILREVLAASGVALPVTNLGAVLRVLPLLLLLRLRGLGFRERPAGALPAAELLRLDACAAAAGGLIHHASIPALYVQQLFLWHALRAGEPRRILQALLGVLGSRALLARPTPSRGEAREQRLALTLAERFPRDRPLLDVILGMACVLRLRIQEGKSYLERAEAALLERSAGAPSDEPPPPINVYGFVGMAREFLAVALLCAGQWSELRRRSPGWLEDARARGDINMERMHLSQFGYLLALCADRPAESHELLDRADALWSDSAQFKAYFLITARGATAHYEGRGVGLEALRIVLELWPAIERSGVLRFNEWVRGECVRQLITAHVAAAAATTGARREEMLRTAERHLRRLTRRTSSRMRWLSWTLGASLAATRGDRERALDLLARAEAACAAGMGMLVAPLRRRRGELLGGDEGQALVDAADAAMRAQGVVDPARVAASMVPGSF